MKTTTQRSSSCRWIERAALGACLALGACRAQPPDELVYTGRRPAEPIDPIDASVVVREDGGTQEAFTKAALVAAIAACTVERYRAFEVEARALEEKARAHAAERSAERLAEARAAWRTAMLAWEEAEPFRFGPAARSSAPGGRNLRDEIYAWPLVNRCKIDEQTVARTYADPSFTGTLISARGMGALEYLLFYEGTDNGCSEFSPINGNGTWAALDATELTLRKAAYAAAAAADVHARAVELVSAWDPAGGDYARTFAEADEQASLNAVSDGLFYLEVEVKDLKLGRPLGLIDCFETRCPDALESRYAFASKEHLAANLAGFRRLFQGCGEGGAGLGFDDWLDSAGASALTDRMLGGIATSSAAIGALDLSLEVALATAPERVAVIHAAVKTVTDPLKTEFVTVLDLELPMTVEGDND